MNSSNNLKSCVNSYGTTQNWRPTWPMNKKHKNQFTKSPDWKIQTRASQIMNCGWRQLKASLKHLHRVLLLFVWCVLWQSSVGLHRHTTEQKWLPLPPLSRTQSHSLLCDSDRQGNKLSPSCQDRFILHRLPSVQLRDDLQKLNHAH